ncbi:MAG: hypothetical protein IJR88_04200 [Clostridia bacterium]|nr:hypothetical protein [Clostridia bacterium]
MEQNQSSRGFVTIATGKEQYYKIAANLLKSYRFFAKEPLPFAIIADQENEYTRLFDKTIILKNPHYSYLDKIELLRNIPYQETIFVESDCLAYADLNCFFNSFENANDFSMFGRSLPLDTKEVGWFKLEETGKYREQIAFHQRFHSAIIYLRQGEICQKIYDVCKDVYDHFEEYNIGGNQEAMDDKLFAIGSAVLHCKMTSNSFENNYTAYCCYPADRKAKRKPKPQIKLQKMAVLDYKREKWMNAFICHWATFNTKRAIYKREICSLEYLENHSKNTNFKSFLYTVALPFSDFWKAAKEFAYKIAQIKWIKKLLKPIVHKIRNL